MKNSFFLIMFFVLLTSCKVNEPDNSIIAPLSVVKIDSLQTEARRVTITATYAIPTPCWYYYITESTNNESVYTSKVFGKYNGKPCIQVFSSLKHKHQIIFLTDGIKKLRFWQNDSTYLDTIINLN